MAKNEAFSDKYISLKKAAKITGYHPDYLSYLIRKKKIDGKKVGRDWFTNEKSIRDYFLTQKFLSIKNFLFFVIKPTTIIIFVLILIIVGLFIFWLINVPAPTQIVPGDFNADEKEMQTKKFNLGNENLNQIEEYKVTSILKNENGEIEISIQSNKPPQKLNANNNWLNQLKEFFKIKF